MFESSVGKLVKKIIVENKNQFGQLSRSEFEYGRTK
jgi:hypothetical protein